MVTAWNVCLVFFFGGDRWEYMDVSKNRYTQIIPFNRVFPCKPSILGYRYFRHTLLPICCDEFSGLTLKWWGISSFDFWGFSMWLWLTNCTSYRESPFGRAEKLRPLGDSVRRKGSTPSLAWVFPHHYEKSLLCLFVAVISMDTSDKTVWL